MIINEWNKCTIWNHVEHVTRCSISSYSYQKPITSRLLWHVDSESTPTMKRAEHLINSEIGTGLEAVDAMLHKEIKYLSDQCELRDWIRVSRLAVEEL